MSTDKHGPLDGASSYASDPGRQSMDLSADGTGGQYLSNHILHHHDNTQQDFSRHRSSDTSVAHSFNSRGSPQLASSVHDRCSGSAGVVTSSESDPFGRNNSFSPGSGQEDAAFGAPRRSSERSRSILSSVEEDHDLSAGQLRGCLNAMTAEIESLRRDSREKSERIRAQDVQIEGQHAQLQTQNAQIQGLKDSVQALKRHHADHPWTASGSYKLQPPRDKSGTSTSLQSRTTNGQQRWSPSVQGSLKAQGEQYRTQPDDYSSMIPSLR